MVPGEELGMSLYVKIFKNTDDDEDSPYQFKANKN